MVDATVGSFRGGTTPASKTAATKVQKIAGPSGVYIQEPVICGFSFIVKTRSSAGIESRMQRGEVCLLLLPFLESTWLFCWLAGAFVSDSSYGAKRF